MVERYRGETILARWVVDEDVLRDFARESRLRSKRSFVPVELLKECDKHSFSAGIEVVLREDAFFVGEWSSPNAFSEVHVTWMQFIGDEGYQIPVPLARGARAEAERVAAHYEALYTREREEAIRRFAEERARPTWNNRFLNFAEANFIWLLLGFFFVLLPLLVLLFGWGGGSPSE
ncbi:MAG TPA: hypothetical protein VGR62_24845 [Candidatus Binatia bacterium]|jgi:hypothetical protein|nr:hypothetical protein [Candidatus Binatia bacterium]